MSIDQLIILAHTKDETVFFYDFITSKTVVVLLTKPFRLSEEEIIMEVMIKKGATLIKLNVTETFDSDYKMDDDTKKKLVGCIRSIRAKKILTMPKIEKEFDSQNRAIFDFIKTLNFNEHYVVNLSDTVSPNKVVGKDIMYFMKMYASIYKTTEQRERLKIYIDTYNKVFDLLKANAL